MKFFLYSLGTALLIGVTAAAWTVTSANNPFHFTEYEEGFDDAPVAEEESDAAPFQDWQRPEGPLKVALQAGHWKNSEVPEELDGLKRNGSGAVGGGTNEQRVVLKIAELAAEQLRAKGIKVDVLPTTVPPDYYADAFVSIHADGSLDPSVTGFKLAHPRRDYSGKSAALEDIFYTEYEKATGFIRDPNVTRRMRGYYAFNWRRYEHAIHPMTPAVILETGFLTSPHDQKILIHKPEVAAQAITDALVIFLGVE